MSTLLSVNLNKIALLRNSRGRNYPDLLQYTQHLLSLGVKGITVHPRPDERHIRYRDVLPLKQLLAQHDDVEFNIEGYPNARFLGLIDDIAPTQCTLVPDADGQLTSNHGFDLLADTSELQSIIARIKQAGVRCAVFLDPISEQIPVARQIGADAIELYTETWADQFAQGQSDTVAEGFKTSIQAAHQHGLRVNAGHDLSLDNLAAFLQLGQVHEVSIGHALTVESIYQGLDQVIKGYRKLCAAGQ
ncbi:MAG: pyridoxine 5'-phosphate synthase [Chromatiales bacterium]|nr:pyridoxine 5'-phosphate synthase [Gammaproteobacteria bacterium]